MLVKKDFYKKDADRWFHEPCDTCERRFSELDETEPLDEQDQDKPNCLRCIHFCHSDLGDPENGRTNLTAGEHDQ